MSSYASSVSSTLTERISGGGSGHIIPRLTGYGGIFADGYTSNFSTVQAAISLLKTRGYNAFRCMFYNSDFPHTCSIQSVIDAVNLAKANNMWIIMDHHAYDANFDTDPL